LRRDKLVKLVDKHLREEFEAVKIEGSILLSQPVMQQLMASGSNAEPIVVIDHAGKNGLDAAAYFMGHGLQNVRYLRGGIDAWVQKVDAKMRRYKLR
jgi:rhodanese-related sulfurtransferase